MTDADADADRGGRLGLIVPSSNATAEPEFRAFCPESVTVHGARIALESVTVDELDAMSDDAARAAELLGHADVDAVAYACTTGSLIHGPGFDAELEDRLAEAAGVPAVATARSVVRALEALEADRIAVATPYTADLDERERDFLEATGVEVAAIDGRGIAANTAIGELTPEDASGQVLERVGSVDDLDAVFVSCTNYCSLAAIEGLEAELGVPVITSNGATLWDICGAAGFVVDGPGTLFESEQR
ncbi:maleate cis-trans isomerase family protein [Natrinema versiforme]|uniref:Asp/Glu/hydantoin racemase n=1 Tax=Natrinema versiforme JCM 10478 TaxID=1227496 RepID=L9Y3R7_9EURY|nr:aspartate/glutamate racemase family protein [Natrinema versiforme]ELY68695.1 Asp/Glu/hydantoin racemase [Natrinema versiforme JCM 10478]